MSRTITTIPELRKAIRTAPAVYCQIRFGCSEKWVQLTKKAALNFVASFPADATPESLEIYGGAFFATVEADGTLSLG